MVTAKAWAVADGGSGEILAGEEVETPLKTASTTKMMTCLVVLGSSSTPARYADTRNLFRWAWSQ